MTRCHTWHGMMHSLAGKTCGKLTRLDVIPGLTQGETADPEPAPHRHRPNKKAQHGCTTRTNETPIKSHHLTSTSKTKRRSGTGKSKMPIQNQHGPGTSELTELGPQGLVVLACESGGVGMPNLCVGLGPPPRFRGLPRRARWTLLGLPVGSARMYKTCYPCSSESV